MGETILWVGFVLGEICLLVCLIRDVNELHRQEKVDRIMRRLEEGGLES